MLRRFLAVCVYHLSPPSPETAVERFIAEKPTASIRIPDDLGASERSA